MRKFMASLLVLFCVCLTKADDDPPRVTKPTPVVRPSNDKEEAVAPTKKTMEKAAEEPPSAEEAGILPLAFVKNRIEAIPVGAKAYVNVECVKCDSKRRVWLDPDQLYGSPSEGRLLLLTRDAGGYHLTFGKIDHQWTCQELPADVKWIPVKTITAK